MKIKKFVLIAGLAIVLLFTSNPCHAGWADEQYQKSQEENKVFQAKEVELAAIYASGPPDQLQVMTAGNFNYNAEALAVAKGLDLPGIDKLPNESGVTYYERVCKTPIGVWMKAPPELLTFAGDMIRKHMPGAENFRVMRGTLFALSLKMLVDVGG